MKVVPYPVKTNKEALVYEFISKGLKGEIVKIVRFEETESLPKKMYNISLVDYDPVTNEYNSENFTGNGDAKKVITTAGKIIMDFLNHFPNYSVYIEGNLKKKTIAYGVAINLFIDSIENNEYEVKGVEGDTNLAIIEVFYDRMRMDYSAYIIRKTIKQKN